VTPEIEEEILQAVADCQYDPQRWALFAWDWGHGDLDGVAGPRDWQRDVNEIIRDHLADPKTRFQPLQIAVASGHGIGKALPVGCIVDTPSGPRRWSDVKLGDSLFASDGAPTIVTATHHFRKLPIYRVAFDDGSFADVSSGHLWNVRGRQERRNGLEEWRTLETIQMLEMGVTRPNGAARAKQWEIPIQGIAQFEAREIDIHPYLVGIWLGDGSKGVPRYCKPYPEIAEKIRGLGYEITDCAGGKTKYIRDVSHLFREGVFLCGSHDRYIPDDYKFNTIENRMALFCGLCDTDGEVHASGSIGYSSTSKRLAEDMIWLARSLGCKAMMHPAIKKGWYPDEHGERVECRDCWRVTINAPFNPFTLEHRKVAYKPSEPRYLKRWIESIEYLCEDDGMCVTVGANDGLYLTNDFIVTHNSAGIGMLSQWAMSCFDDAKVTVTANTETQLRTKTVPEVRKWFGLAINAMWFDPQATTIKSMDPAHKESWRVDFIPWSEHNTEAFAGLHNKGKLILLVFDESSKIGDKVWEVAEGALTDEDTVIIWLVFGNPTRNTGRFRECFRRFRHRWVCKQIDSRTVPGTNKKKIAEWEQDHGEDSDFFKIRVRGQFPAQSAMQFIGTDDVDHARHAMLGLRKDMIDFAPKIIGLDPAWTGEDTLEIFLRQGLYSKHLRTITKNDNDIQVANLLANLEDELKADAVFIDGGYGTGIVSAGKTLGRNWQLVWFSEKPYDAGYVNKRAEMWGLMKRWLKEGGAIEPNDEVLYQDLIGLETVPRLDGKILLESKEDMKARGVPSPNRADALALTFAHPVAAKSRDPVIPRPQREQAYDPFESYTRV
jgi:hypothetical protein